MSKYIAEAGEVEALLTERLATPEGLRAWLSGVPPETPVGRSGDECDCPLANYLERTMPVRPAHSDFAVWPYRTGGTVEWWLSGDDDEPMGYHCSVALPTWANTFGFTIDDASEDQWCVTAGEALETLDKSCPRE